MQTISQTKRARAGSVSGRLRSVSELCTEGLITNEQKSIVRDLIVSGDKELEQSLDNFLQGNKSDIVNLINKGHLDTRKSTFDFLDSINLDSINFGNNIPQIERNYSTADGIMDNYYSHPRTSSVNPYNMMKLHDSSIAEIPVPEYSFDTQPKSLVDSTYSSQFGNFIDYQNERDSDYIDSNMLSYTTMDTRSDSMSPSHNNYSEAYQSLSFINNNQNLNSINNNNYNMYMNPTMSTTQSMDTNYMNNYVSGNVMNQNSNTISPQTINTYGVNMMNTINNNTNMINNMNTNYMNTMNTNMNNNIYNQSTVSSLQKPPPIKTSEHDLIPVDISKHEPGKKYIGAYSPDSRRKRIEKFLEKRKQRVWTKRVKYDVRKNFADSRLRVKGRFVKKEDEELLRELMNLT